MMLLNGLMQKVCYCVFTMDRLSAVKKLAVVLDVY